MNILQFIVNYAIIHLACVAYLFFICSHLEREPDLRERIFIWLGSPVIVLTIFLYNIFGKGDK